MVRWSTCLPLSHFPLQQLILEQREERINLTLPPTFLSVYQVVTMSLQGHQQA